MMEMTDDMFIYYRAKLQGENLSLYKEPCIEYDTAIGPSYGGGGDVVVWSDPYYILFINEEQESAKCDLVVKYDYGELESIGYEVLSLDADNENEMKEGDDRMETPWVVFCAVVIAVLMLVLAYAFLGRERERS
ncbi:MAG: hypothetical protein U9R75_03180, partial [Candidatus Thermoplasmatota archaeon]|nr:hypothetical protein [Candidatus Thermoplasmatota archaeon]